MALSKRKLVKVSHLTSYYDCRFSYFDREYMGECIETRRRDLRLTRSQVVDKLIRPRSVTWLFRIESGSFIRLPVPEEFRSLCRILRLNPLEILTISGFLTLEEGPK